MPINLSKGQKVSLSKGNPGLKKIVVGLGWDVNAFDSGSDFDLDAAAFLVGANGKCTSDKDFVFYGNLEHSSGAVKHMGDNLTGCRRWRRRADSDRSEPGSSQHREDRLHGNDPMTRRADARISVRSPIPISISWTESNNTELIRFDLGEDFSIETAVVVGELYKHNGEWKFNAIGSGFQGGLAALCAHYGIDAE